MVTHKAQSKMQTCLDRLAIPLAVAWIPKANSSVHGEIKEHALFIYDDSEDEAWATLEHEIYEFRLKDVTATYRQLVNSLIEGVERLTYERKEKFLEFLPQIHDTVSQYRKRRDMELQSP